MLKMMMMITRWEQVTKQDLTDGHSHPVNKEPTTDYMPQVIVVKIQTSQELRMLSSVTLNCQVTKIVMNSGSQLSEL